MSLIVIAAVIPSVSALYSCNETPVLQFFSGNAPWTMDANGYDTQALVNGACTACGFSTSGAHLHFTGRNLNNDVVGSRTSGYGDWIATNNDTRFVESAIWCQGGTRYVNIYDGSCYGASAPSELVTYYFRTDTPTSECVVGSIRYSPIDFIGSPLSGPSPLSVNFLISNFTFINATGALWSFGDGNVSSSHSATNTHLYQNPGTYSVRFDFFNISGFAGYIQKNNYITVGAPNATKTKYFQTIDGTNGNIVLNSSIQLQDIENSSWVNATGLINDGMSSITTLEGHTINAYAQSLGYSDADDLGILNDGKPQYIMMWPTFAKDVSAGNVSLYVTVKDKDTKANIVGAQVIASTPKGSQSTTTNDAGIAYFIVTNNTMVLITAQAIGLGYQAATTTINTGTASGGSASAAATILLGRSTTILPTYVPTTLPGQPGVTPGPTPLPGCEDTISAAGQEKCRAAQSNQGLSFLSGNLLGLIQICFVVTILYLLGIKLGK